MIPSTMLTYQNAKWDNDAERYAGNSETEVANELGEPARENHTSEGMVRSDKPTEHTAANADGDIYWSHYDDYGEPESLT